MYWDVYCTYENLKLHISKFQIMINVPAPLEFLNRIKLKKTPNQTSAFKVLLEKQFCKVFLNDLWLESAIIEVNVP